MPLILLRSSIKLQMKKHKTSLIPAARNEGNVKPIIAVKITKGEIK